MRTIDFVTVATILRSPYHLVYALPLLFISITLLFAGTFLTLDRTRSFPSSSDVKTKPPFYRLESGIGGLAIGWALGAHTSTLVALLVLNQTETAHLGPPVFLVVWLSSTIGFTLVCGRWKYAALGFGGILGGGCIGLLLAISLHPSLLARYILTVVCIILVTTGGLVPYPLVRHTSLRVGTSAAGAVGIINACAILGGPSNTKLASWSSAWLHLVLPHDSDTAELQWDAGKSKGLTAAAFFLWMIGAACDWWLRRRIGEDPDEAWDGVLGSYSTNFPPEASRIGTFTPTKSPWARLVDKLRFSSDNTNVEKPLLFPPDLQLARSTPAAPAGIKPPPVFRPRKPGTFTPDPYESDSDSDLGEGEKVARRAMKERKWTTSTNFSDTTLVNPRPERLRKHHGIMGGAFERGYMPPILTSSPSGTRIEYGDKDAERSPELNMGSHRIEPSRDDDKDWRPVFLKRSESIRSSKAEMVDSIESQDVTTARTPGTQTPAYHYSGPTTPIRGPTSSYVHGTVPTPGLVPATPSLIYAMDRVSQAQRLAYARGTDASAEQHYQAGSDTAISKMGGGIEGLPSTGRHGHERGWKGFWAEVQQKAAQP